MGFIRGALVTIITILLFISLFSAAGFLTVSMSLDYNVIKPEVHRIVSDIILNQTDMDEQIDEAMAGMQFYCQNNTVFVQNVEGYTLELPCEVINQGSEAVIIYAIDDMVEKNYYKEYDCEFRECFSQEENMFFVFSKHSQNYWNYWFYISLIISIILGVLLFFCMESKTSFPFLLGILLIVVSAPFLGMGKLLGLLIGWEYVEIFSAFFTQAYSVFLIFLVLGVISIGIGIIMKFLSVGRFFAKIFKKDDKLTKKDLKEAIQESKKKK